MSTASRFRAPKESRMLKYPACFTFSGKIHANSTDNFYVSNWERTWSIPRASCTGIRNLPVKHRQAIKREEMARRLLSGEYTSKKRQNRLTARLSTQITRLKRAA